ncbi:MAG: hypothetical protein EXS01_04940 [Phycisphaerales bacterium]|nr:hypothetical protein [Phycisphaerales bacterium]
MNSLTILEAAVLLTSSASATFTSFTVGMSSVDGRDVYSVFANFTSASDSLLSLIDHSTTSGSMNALHNDFAGGTWSVQSGLALSDSYATGWGLATLYSFDTMNPAETLAEGATWYGTSGAPAGQTLRVKILQIARLDGDTTQFTGHLELGYKLAGTTTILFGSGSYTIPAPTASALLALTGFVQRRRRF